MTSKTRYVLMASFLVLFAGLSTGLLAYYLRFSTGALFADDGPDELRLIAPDATLLAFANVREIMTSDMREHVRRALPRPPAGREEFLNETGINVETDIDRAVAGLTRAVAGVRPAGLVLARGRFDAVRIEARMRDRGAQVADYKGVRLITATESPARAGGLSIAFIEPGLVGVGNSGLVRTAVDLKSGGTNVTSIEEVMKLVRSLDGGNAWVVGRTDALASQVTLPSGLATQLLPIEWFAASAHVNGGLSATLRAEARDEASADNLRDVVRGFLALARMQVGSKPELQALVQSLDIRGTGTSVAVSFRLPAGLLDLLGAGAR